MGEFSRAHTSSRLPTLPGAFDAKPLGDDCFEARRIEQPPAPSLRRQAARPGAGHGRAHAAGPCVSRAPCRLPVSRRSEASDRALHEARPEGWHFNISVRR